MLVHSAFKPRRRNSRRAVEWKRCAPYLQWLRGRPCMLHGRGGCDGKIVAAHVDYAGDKGMGTKVNDRFAIPLCGGFNGHHAAQHAWGWKTFEANFKINALEASKAYWAAWPGRYAWENGDE